MNGSLYSIAIFVRNLALIPENKSSHLLSGKENVRFLAEIACIQQITFIRVATVIFSNSVENTFDPEYLFSYSQS
jgi:hypothetical protein